MATLIWFSRSTDLREATAEEASVKQCCPLVNGACAMFSIPFFTQGGTSCKNSNGHGCKRIDQIWITKQTFHFCERYQQIWRMQSFVNTNTYLTTMIESPLKSIVNHHLNHDHCRKTSFNINSSLGPTALFDYSSIDTLTTQKPKCYQKVFYMRLLRIRTCIERHCIFFFLIEITVSLVVFEHIQIIYI